MQQVLLNLISNAIKFSDFYGQVIVRVEQLFATGDEKKKDQLQISVTDNGRGIKKKDKNKLFKAYGSIKSEKINQRGIGLGLLISKLIVNKFNGIIDYVSTWKKGTTFFFTFDLEELDSMPSVGDFCAINSITKKIMVVDDEEFCLEAI